MGNYETKDGRGPEVWHARYRGIKRLIPRWERVFLSIPSPLSRLGRVALKTDGWVRAVWCNGVRLHGGRSGYPVPHEIQRPFENEFLIHGLPSRIWIERDFEGGDRATAPRPATADPDPLSFAGEALVRFLVDEGPCRGDMFSFFDPAAMTFRMPTWRWDTGICLEALARLALSSGSPDFPTAVERLVKRLLAVQLTDPRCEGGFPETCDPHMAGKAQKALPQWVVPFNAAFIGAGLIAASGIPDFPLASQCVEAAVRAHRLMTEMGISEQGRLTGYFSLNTRTWTYHGQINDSAVFPRLSKMLAKIGRLENGEKVLRYSRAIADFVRPEGFVGRARWMPGPDTWPRGNPLFPEWKRYPDRIPSKIFSRGQAWFLLGMTGASALDRDREGTAQVRRVADYLLAHQDPSGLWHHDLGNRNLGLDVKGSAVVLWALLEAESVFREGGGDAGRFDDAVTRAWRALEDNRNANGKGPLPGALKDEGEEGAIIYFRNRPIYTAYGTAAFILAGLLLRDRP